MITCVHHGVTNKLPLLLRLLKLDQSNDRFNRPIPPNPEPRKFAVAFLGATQHRNAMEPSIGKINSGRNCHVVTNASAEKNTFICFLETRVGCAFCFFCVSKRAV